MSLVHYTTCPVCDSHNIHLQLTVDDHSVSGENFAIWQCGDCNLRFTQDVPDATSIGAYYKSENYISHTNTAKGVINQLYLRVRKVTLQLKSNTIKRHTGLTSGSLLDVGAGTGAFLHHIQQQGWEVTGIEPEADARNVAQQLFKLSLQPSEDLKKLPQKSFDVITLWHVLEHVHALHEYMDILKSLLKPGGKLFIAVPNYQSLDATIYKSFWAAYDVPRHLYHFCPQSIQRLVKRHGLRVLAQRPMWFDAFYISLLSSKYENRKTNWMSALMNGIRSNSNALQRNQQCSSLIYIIAV